MTEPLVPEERENSPPVVIARTPDSSDIQPSQLLGTPPVASLTFSLEIEDANNPDDLSVFFYVDFPGGDFPPCDPFARIADVAILVGGTRENSRIAQVSQSFTTAGCHKVEAIACDGERAAGVCASRVCAADAFEVRETWFICAHDELVGECMVPGGGCE